MRSACRAAPALLAVLLAAVLAGCGSSGDSVNPTPAASVDGPASSAAPDAQRTVLLDPGHNGGNAAHPKEINRKVPDGRGGTKACNTVGTQTDKGLPEHAFNLDVALRVQDLLESNHIKVVLTRDSDDGWGPCVDARGKQAEQVNADAAVSIHADGAAPTGHGFHVIYPKPPLNTAQGAPSVALATALRDGMKGEQVPTSTYAGKNGLIGRSDLAGLNLSKRPTALVECGNMKSPEDTINMSSSPGRQRYANGIAQGILSWLAHNPPDERAALAQSDPSSDADTPSKSARSSSSTKSTSSARKRTTSSTESGSGSTASTKSRSSATSTATDEPSG